MGDEEKSINGELSDMLGDGYGQDGEEESGKGEDINEEGNEEEQEIEEKEGEEEDNDREDEKSSEKDSGKEVINTLKSQIDKQNEMIEKLTSELLSKGKGDEGEDKAPKELPNLLTPEEHDIMNDSPDVINNAFNKWTSKAIPEVIVPQIKEALARELPIMVANLVGRQVTLKSAAENFYKNNPELDKPEYKNLVRFQCQEVEAENPGKGPDWVFAETAKKVKKMVGIIDKGKASDKARTPGPKEKSRVPGKLDKGKLDDLQKSTLEDMVNFSEEL